MDYDISPLEMVKFSNVKTRALRFENVIIENEEIYHYPLTAEGKSLSPIYKTSKMFLSC